MFMIVYLFLDVCAFLQVPIDFGFFEKTTDKSRVVDVSTMFSREYYYAGKVNKGKF